MQNEEIQTCKICQKKAVVQGVCAVCRSEQKPVRHKFNARPTISHGIRFASKKESEYYEKLLFAQRSGNLLFFLRQVPFHLLGGVKYVVDYVEFWAEGDVRFVDCKGYRTRTYINKKKQVEATYPITILEL